MDEKNLRSILSVLKIKVINKSGNWLDFACPFARWTHKKGVDKNPSCGAVVDNNAITYYKCHTCKMGGRISSLVRSMERYTETKIKGLALKADLAEAEVAIGEFEDYEDYESGLPEPLSSVGYGDIFDPVDEVDAAMEYLESRGIVDEEVWEFLDIRYDYDEARIMFPVRDNDDNLYGYTGRTILDKEQYPYPKFPKVRDYYGLPKRHLLLGAELHDAGKPVLVVEGLFAYLTMYQLGVDAFCNIVALLGSEVTKSKAEILKEWNETTILLTDPDHAGDTCLFGKYNNEKEEFEGGGAVDKLYDHIPLIVPEYPEDCDDPDDLTYDEVYTMVNETPLYFKG